MEWDKNQNCVGWYFVKISDYSIYNLGLTYDKTTGYYYDAEGYSYKANGNIGTTITFVRNGDNVVYNTGLSHVDGAKYYTDSLGDKYLLAYTSKGGMTMHPTGSNAISMYEMSFFAKMYNPAVVVLTGGTNDSPSTYGTVDDAECTLSLNDCSADTLASVSVCSAVKGAIRRISTDCPHAHIILEYATAKRRTT